MNLTKIFALLQQTYQTGIMAYNRINNSTSDQFFKTVLSQAKPRSVHLIILTTKKESQSFPATTPFTSAKKLGEAILKSSSNSLSPWITLEWYSAGKSGATYCDSLTTEQNVTFMIEDKNKKVQNTNILGVIHNVQFNHAT